MASILQHAPICAPPGYITEEQADQLAESLAALVAAVLNADPPLWVQLAPEPVWRAWLEENL